MSTARQIADDIQAQVEAGAIASGQLIGTEADLRARHRISLATLRQTIRILEQRQVAVMRRGVNGGLYAEQPTVDATANYIVALWERGGTSRQAFQHDVQAFGTLVLRRAIERMTIADATRIAQLHANCQDDNEPIVRSARALLREQAIAEMTGNPVIVLGHAATGRYLRNLIPFEDLAWDDPAFAEQARNLIDAKIAALVAGDVAAATRAANDYTQAYFDRMDDAANGSLPHAAAEALARPGSLPTLVSRKVLRDIRDRGWNEGEFLGQEPELMQKYGVGRNTWRQALSILIEYSAVESRRGGGGGLYVAPINRASVMETASAWLSRQGARPADGLDVFAHLVPHHAAAAFIARDASIGNQPASCKTLVEDVLSRQSSPLLTLAGLAFAPSLLDRLPSIDLEQYRQVPSGTDLVKRTILTAMEALF